jgi:hypothetical protein
MACVAKAVTEFLPFEFFRLFRVEFGRDKRGLGARRIIGSVRADAPATTAAPAMSEISVMFFIYIVVFFRSFSQRKDRPLAAILTSAQIARYGTLVLDPASLVNDAVS